MNKKNLICCYSYYTTVLDAMTGNLSHKKTRRLRLLRAIRSDIFSFWQKKNDMQTSKTDLHYRSEFCECLGCQVNNLTL